MTSWDVVMRDGRIVIQPFVDRGFMLRGNEWWVGSRLSNGQLCRSSKAEAQGISLAHIALLIASHEGASHA